MRLKNGYLLLLSLLNLHAVDAASQEVAEGL